MPCQLAAHVSKPSHILQLPPMDCEWIVGSGILAQNFCFLANYLDSYGGGSLAEFLPLTVNGLFA